MDLSMSCDKSYLSQ